MPMTVVVTRDVQARYRGFLASCMLEIAPGIYTAPNMRRGVRERVWKVMEEWYGTLGRGAIVMTWRDASHPAGQGLAFLGEPPKEIIEQEGMLLVRHPLSALEIGTDDSNQKAKKNP